MVRRIRQLRGARALDARDRGARPEDRSDDRQPVRVADSADAVTAAAAIVKELLRDRDVEQARLEGVQLAAREMAHLLNNDLAVAMGLVEILQERHDLPAHLRELLAGASASLDSAAQHVRLFQGVVRVETRETPAGPSLDLVRSRV